MTTITDQSKRQYIALRQLRVSPEKTYDYGEAVPEANEWPASAVVALLHTGQLGEGPACNHEVAINGVHTRIDTVISRYDDLNAKFEELRGLLLAKNVEEETKAAINNVTDDDSEVKKTNRELLGKDKS